MISKNSGESSSEFFCRRRGKSEPDQELFYCGAGGGAGVDLHPGADLSGIARQLASNGEGVLEVVVVVGCFLPLQADHVRRPVRANVVQKYRGGHHIDLAYRLRDQIDDLALQVIAPIDRLVHRDGKIHIRV